MTEGVPTQPPADPDEATGSVPVPPAGMSGAPGLLFRLVRDQRVAFLLVGATNTGVGFILFVLADLTVGRWVDSVAGRTAGSIATLACAHLIAVVFAFVLYRTFVFRVRGHVVRDFIRFQAVYLVSFGINLIVLPGLVALGWPRILAQLSILGVTVTLSWFGHKYFSFRRGPGPDSSGEGAL